MSALESFILSYLFNSLWQIPLLFAAGWIAARLLRPAGPAAEHRAWVTALLASALLPACSALPFERIMTRLRLANSHALAHGSISIQMGAGTTLAGLHLPHPLLPALAALYCAVAAYFLIRFIWRCARLSVLSRDSASIELTGGAALVWKLCRARFGLGSVAIASSPRIFAPVTLGVIHPRVLLPSGMENRLEHPDFAMVVAHEFAHIRRGDFLKNLLYELISLPVSYHPLFRLTRQRLMESREMVCDQMAARVSGNHQYAQSLLRLASLLVIGTPIPVPHVIGVFDANTLERRLMRLTQKNTQAGRMRRFALIAASIALGATACASAFALRLAVDSDSASTASNPNSAAAHSVPPAEMAKNILHKVPPVYPPDAKEAGIQGTVVLQAIIDKSGRVDSLKVISGPAELQQSALDAVRQWTYKPFLVDGEAVEVKTTVNIIYSLQR